MDEETEELKDLKRVINSIAASVQEVEESKSPLFYLPPVSLFIQKIRKELESLL